MNEIETVFKITAWKSQFTGCCSDSREILRRLRDSNPRYPLEVYTLSRRAPSTTRTSLLTKGCKFTVCYGSLNKFLAFSVVNSAILSRGKLQIVESFSATSFV